MINKLKYKKWKAALCRNDEENERCLLKLQETQTILEDIVNTADENTRRVNLTSSLT